MTKLWPNEVSENSKSEKQFKIQIWSRKDWAGKFPAQHPSRHGCRLGCRHTQGGVDLQVDTPVDLGGRAQATWVRLLVSLVLFWKLLTGFEGSDLS